jgi:PAS domain S-box-containing protein
VNLNKLFPRLGIRAKLAIAFVLIASIPLVVVAAVAIRVQVDHLRDTAKAYLDYDMEIARAQMEEALREAEESVAYLARSLLAPALEAPTRDRLVEASRRVSSFLEHKPSLYQVSLIDGDGSLLMAARATQAETIYDDLREDGQPSGMLYVFLAQSLEPGGHLLLPVELKSRAAGGTAPVPAVAIVKPVWDAVGGFRGAVAGEVHASALFAALESESPRLPGVTGVVDGEGLFLYHSLRKRDWSTLLAAREEVDLRSEFSPDLAAMIMGGVVGTATADRQIVSYAPLALGSYGTGPLFLYRAVPTAVLEAPLRNFLWWAGMSGLGLGAIVLGLAAAAANQFTRPIYRFRAGMRRLTDGEEVSEPLGIETNDELEDLAGDFTEMAVALSTYRHRLEHLVAERTRALHETYAELANVLAHSADAIIGLDLAGRVRVWNRGAEALFGYAEAEAIGQPVHTLIHLRDGKSDHETAFLKRKLEESGAVVDFRTKRVRKDGEPLSVSLTQSVIRGEEGEPLGYSLILRDARMQAKLEGQMRRSERLAAASVMATALAHEVNNPLAIIGNRIEVMQREVQSRCPECRLDDDLSVLLEHTERLTEVTRGLLDLASNEREEAAGKVDLAALAERVARLTEQIFSARGVRLDVRSLGESPPTLHGNEKALETVCLNLLLNAADATPSGGTVFLETRTSRDGNEVELEVRDTGPGVPANLQEQIFEPFFTTKGPRGGTGLGLAVCRSVVERHGGRIRLASAAGEGSRFIVAIPLLTAVSV